MDLQWQDRWQYSQVKRRWFSLKGAAVALILAMHALGLYFLLLPARQLKQYTEVAFMTLMPARPPAPIAAAQLPLPLPISRPISRPVPGPTSRAPAPSMPSASVSTPAVAETITLPPVDELAATPATLVAQDLHTRARLSAGAIDKTMRTEVRKETPWLVPPPIESQSKFQKLAASAFRGGPVLTVEDYQTADGRPASRVRSAVGSRCYAMAENPGSGADPFKTGGKVKQVPCPG